MTDKGLMIQCLKNKHISIDEMIEQNYTLFDRITRAMNEYHQAKLKLLNIPVVSVPKGTLCLICEKEEATLGIGHTKTACPECWNKMID